MSKQYLKIYRIVAVIFIFPLISFAQVSEVTCSKSGYTVATINGIFTKEGTPGGSDGAEANRIAVKRLFPTTYKSENLTFEYLYNPTHGFFGAIDVTDVAIQKTFEGVDMSDPDFLRMLTDASQKVKTQKLLLVSHSQGNFYANNFYNTVTRDGDISPKSIGVYGIASPANSVGGNGSYLTSSTDTVINKVRKVLPGTVLRANDSIEYKETDDSGRGHGFREIYLNYRGEEIKQGIEESLAKLSINPNRSESIPCIISPEERTTLEKVSHVVDYSAQFTVAAGVTAVTARNNLTIDYAIKKIPSVIFVTLSAYNNTVTAVVWVHTTALSVGNVVTNLATDIGSFAKDTFTGLLSGAPILANNNSASVILATLPPQNLTKTNVVNNNAPVVATPPVVVTPTAPGTQSTAVPPTQAQTVFVLEPKGQTGTIMPKLVFIGLSPGFGGGAPTLPVSQVLGTQNTVPVVEEVIVIDEEIMNTGEALAAPELSVLQCAQTLATDGCLIATTTVHFEWPEVTGVNHYYLSKNGTNATTTDTSLDVEIKDFSDYTFEINSVGANGEVSATSTQKVSVATIPIAINEIAWMGTLASVNDEWFEIKNNTTHTIDLSQWELNAKDGTPHVKLAGTIAPKEYLVFERTDNNTIIDVEAHQTYTGALGNAGEQLNLSYASTTLDQTPDGAWVSGENSTTTKKTMERYSSREAGINQENWGTNLDYIKNGTDANGNLIDGTPGAQNSVSTLINKGQDITSNFTLTADEERYVDKEGIWINASSTLTIEPGVTVSFYSGGGAGFFVQGQILADGTNENPIIFNTDLGNRGNGYFYLDNGAGTSTFNHVVIENTGNIALDNTDLEIRNTDFINTDGGIDVYNGSTLLVENTHFASTTREAIGVYGGSVVLASSTITNTLDTDAIGIYDGSSFSMVSTVIEDVYNGSGVAAYDSSVSIASSTIRNTEGSAIYLSNSTSTIESTLVEGGVLNDWTIGVDIYQGTAAITNTIVSGFSEVSGIAVADPIEPVVIVRGEITGNAVGVEMYPADSVVMTDVSIHDNGTSEADNVVVW